MELVSSVGPERIGAKEAALAAAAGRMLREKGLEVFQGQNQGGTVSFRGRQDCEEIGAQLSREGIAVRAGLHCAPLAHQSVGTVDTGTVRLSFGFGNTEKDLMELEWPLERLK